MKENVRIKSFSKGLIIQLSGEAPFDDLLSEVSNKFREGKSFFGDAAVAVTFQGRELDPEEEELLINAIHYNCHLRVVCVVSKDEEKEKLFVRTVQFAERQSMAQTAIEDEVQVFRGDLTQGEHLDTPSSIIILGNVEGGCSITSEKNIMILGSLYGEAHAGYGARHAKNFVIAMEMTPEVLTIGDFIYAAPKKSMWAKKKKEQMLVAKVQDRQIAICEFTKEYLDRF